VFSRRPWGGSSSYVGGSGRALPACGELVVRERLGQVGDLVGVAVDGVGHPVRVVRAGALGRERHDRIDEPIAVALDVDDGAGERGHEGAAVAVEQAGDPFDRGLLRVQHGDHRVRAGRRLGLRVRRHGVDLPLRCLVGREDVPPDGAQRDDRLCVLLLVDVFLRLRDRGVDPVERVGDAARENDLVVGGSFGRDAGACRPDGHERDRRDGEQKCESANEQGILLSWLFFEGTCRLAAPQQGLRLS